MRTRQPGVRPIPAILAALLAVGVIAAPVAAAAPPAGVTIVSNVTFNPDGPNFGDFTATGAAVDSGRMCASGTFEDFGIKFAGFQGHQGDVQLQVFKTFTCADGSGTFDVKMQIQATPDTGIET